MEEGCADLAESDEELAPPQAESVSAAVAIAVVIAEDSAEICADVRGKELMGASLPRVDAGGAGARAP